MPNYLNSHVFEQNQLKCFVCSLVDGEVQKGVIAYIQSV